MITPPCPAIRHATGAYPDPACRCGAPSRPRWGTVPATRTHRQLQALAVAGHRAQDLARELGFTGRPGVSNILARAHVSTLTQTLVDDLYRKISATPGKSPETARRAHTNLWLPRAAWDHSDINSIHPLAEITALLAWLQAADDPAPALAELLRRADRLPLAACQIIGRRAHARRRAGDHRPVIHECWALARRVDRSARKGRAA